MVVGMVTPHYRFLLAICQRTHRAEKGLLTGFRCVLSKIGIVHLSKFSFVFLDHLPSHFLRALKSIVPESPEFSPLANLFGPIQDVVAMSQKNIYLKSGVYPGKLSADKHLKKFLSSSVTNQKYPEKILKLT
jgi:hypothetical protein